MARQRQTSQNPTAKISFIRCNKSGRETHLLGQVKSQRVVAGDCTLMKIQKIQSRLSLEVLQQLEGHCQKRALRVKVTSDSHRLSISYTKEQEQRIKMLKIRKQKHDLSEHSSMLRSVRKLQSERLSACKRKRKNNVCKMQP